MAMSKKGIFFTFTAIVLALIILISFNVYTTYQLKDKMEPIEIRVDTMNDFIKDLENDIENAIFIAGFRSLLSLEDYMMKYDTFLSEDDAPSLAAAFEEAFHYGTITTGLVTENMPLMENNTFLNWTERMKVQANKTGIELKFNIDSVTISQSEPWMVDVKVRLDISVQDKKNIASWTITNKEYTTKINITTPPAAPISEKKFVDPLYLISTSGLVNNTIRETPYLNWPEDLGLHLNGYFYREHSDAPSYLMRFENNLGSSPYGIESLVYLPNLQAKGLAIYSKSTVDYIYFGSTNPEKCNIDGMEASHPWFYLDKTAHISFYEAACYAPP